MIWMRRVFSFGGVTLLLWGLTAGTAFGKPLEQEHFHEVSSKVREDFCGLTVREDIDVKGSFLLNSRGPDGLAYGKEVSRGSVSWTNLANGLTFTQRFSTNIKDLKVTDNGDGTLTILVLATGGSKVYGPDGKLFSDTGQIRFEILIDPAGTPTDLGVVKESTGTNDLEGRDFCADIHEFIG